MNQRVAPAPQGIIYHMVLGLQVEKYLLIGFYAVGADAGGANAGTRKA